MQRALQNVRLRLSVIAAVAFIVIAVLGTWRAFDSVWTPVGQERLAYRDLTPQERQNASAAGLADVRVLAFWAARIHRGDRYYLNVPPSTKAFANWPSILGEIVNYYVVPATPVAEPDRATVVLSWGRKPASVGLPYASSAKLAGVDASISRVAR